MFTYVPRARYNQAKLVDSIYVSRLKSSSQHEDGITRQNHFDTTIVHALKDV